MKTRSSEDYVAITIVGVVVMLLTMLCTTAHSAEIPKEQAIHAILGEARGEGYAGMYAVACAIRNRGTLHGVYGVRADISDADEETRMKAETAWLSSKTGKDLTNGATMWENIEVFGKPYWFESMEETYKYGSHTFFKPKKTIHRDRINKGKDNKN